MLDESLRINSSRILRDIPEDKNIDELQDEAMTEASLNDTSVLRAKKLSSVDKPPKKKMKKNGKRRTPNNTKICNMPNHSEY